MNKRINNSTCLKTYRKDLRAKLTSAEVVLWQSLKNSQLDGRKFRRQHSIGNYILDFYCPAEGLAIELDGAQHFTLSGLENDFKRDNFLLRFGIRTLRVENESVFKNHEGVLQLIKDNFRNS